VGGAGRVEIFPSDDPRRIYHQRRSGTGARWIHGGKCPDGRPQKAVKRNPVKIGSDDHAGRVDGSRGSAEGRSGTWCIERGDIARATPQEAVLDTFCVEVGTGDVLSRVDATRNCCSGARWIERREGPVRSS